ncbi:MAG: substrate-binding domain-containing protein, partial [Pseudolabrys sp.]
ALNARSVAYTDPKAGGSGGIMFSALLEKLGIAEAINKKAVLGKSGHDVTTSIAEGRAEIGTTFISEVPEACCASLAIRQLVLAGLLQAWSPLFRIVKDLARRHGFT